MKSFPCTITNREVAVSDNDTLLVCYHSDLAVVNIGMIQEEEEEEEEKKDRQLSPPPSLAHPFFP